MVVEEPNQLGPATLSTTLASTRVNAMARYVDYVRPMVLTITIAITTIISIAWPKSARPATIVFLLLATAISWIAAGLMRLGADVRTTTVVLTAIDVPLVAVWASTTGSPGEALSGLAIPILVGAWLLGPRIATLLSLASVAASLTIWFTLGAWSAPELIPDIAFILAAIGAIAIALSTATSRSYEIAIEAERTSAKEHAALARSRRQLVTNVSHELRTPLTTVNGFLDTLLRPEFSDGVRDGDTRAMLEHARLGGARLETLIDQLLEFERAEVGDANVARAPQRLNTIIQLAANTIDMPPERALNVDPIPTDVSIDCDPLRMQRTIAALIENAVIHGSGDIVVSFTHDESVGSIEISDGGPGVPAARRGDLFEPFASNSATGARGLGLAMAYAYVSAIGGLLTYESPDSRGDERTRFCIRVPLVNVDV